MVFLCVFGASCRDEELILYAAYTRQQLTNGALRTDGYYYRHLPPCGRTVPLTEVAFFYDDGTCYWSTLSIDPPTDTNLFHLEQKMRNSERLNPADRKVHGFGWGLYQWRSDTLYVEQFVLATRGRMRVAVTRALLRNGLLQELFTTNSLFLKDGSSACLAPLRFRPCAWRPDPSMLFEENRSFRRSQGHFLKRRIRKEERAVHP